jgi:hypothetical protein
MLSVSYRRKVSYYFFQRFQSKTLRSILNTLWYIKNHSKRVVQLYTQALGSLFVASYDSQVYGGGIGTSLHTVVGRTSCLLSFEMTFTA